MYGAGDDRIESEHVSAKRLADVAKESYDTIDHWAERGLLVFTRKGRRRWFHLDTNLARVHRIREMQNRGHSLEGIKEALASTK